MNKYIDADLMREAIKHATEDWQDAYCDGMGKGPNM